MNAKSAIRVSLLLVVGLVIALLAGCGAPASKPAAASAETWNEFEAELESLRQLMKIPGMSAAVVKDGELRLGARLWIRRH